MNHYQSKRYDQIEKQPYINHFDIRSSRERVTNLLKMKYYYTVSQKNVLLCFGRALQSRTFFLGHCVYLIKVLGIIFTIVSPNIIKHPSNKLLQQTTSQFGAKLGPFNKSLLTQLTKFTIWAPMICSPASPSLPRGCQGQC